MGQKIVDIYEAIGKEDGKRGQMRLAMKTGITATIGREVQDTPERLAVFASAFNEITKKECPINFSERAV